MLILRVGPEGEVRLYTSDGPVVVKVVGLTGTAVRLGVTAPRAVKVYREAIDPYQPATEGREEASGDDAD